MEEAIISIFTKDSLSDPPLLTSDGLFKGLRRTVFRASANSKYGKNLRWRTEKTVASLVRNKRFSRNQLLNEGIEVFQNTDTSYTDILQEYFIPYDSVNRFLALLKITIPMYKVDLLNITVRNVEKDDDVFLSYANEKVFGFVMLFNQKRNETDENEMKRLNQRLTDIALSLNGTYYLPYRLHATKAQFYKAYPQAKQFFELKEKYDPNKIFSNTFYNTYN